MGLLAHGGTLDAARRSDLADFRSFDMVMLTLFRMLLGNFDYLAMHRSNYIVAPLLFTSYMLVLVFLLLNMLAALCVDAYAQLSCKVRQAGLRLRPHCRCAASRPEPNHIHLHVHARM